MNLREWAKKKGEGVLIDGLRYLSDETGLTERCLKGYAHGQRTPGLLEATMISSATGGQVWFDDMLKDDEKAALTEWQEEGDE